MSLALARLIRLFRSSVVINTDMGQHTAKGLDELWSLLVCRIEEYGLTRLYRGERKFERPK